MVERPEEKTHKGMLAWWARNSVAANLLMIIAFVGGIIGFTSMQRENNPAAVFPGASISVAWPGASPRDVEEQIIVRIEEALSDLDGVDELTAVALILYPRYVDPRSRLPAPPERALDWLDGERAFARTRRGRLRDAVRAAVSRALNFGRR